MKNPFAIAPLIFGGLILLAGCGGAADNAVAPPPEKVPTAEELAASYESQAQDYQQQQAEMRKRDSSR